MARQTGYKKYMKKTTKKNNHFFINLFLITLFGMLIIFTYVFKSFTPDVDVSIGDYKPEPEISEESKSFVDGRLSMIQDEDQGRNFSDLMANVEKIQPTNEPEQQENKEVSFDQRFSQAIDQNNQTENTDSSSNTTAVTKDIVYKVYIGTYTSIEQAKVAKDIILESNNGLNPIVKCIGSNDYTLQVGIFKNKSSAESLLYTVQQNHLPGRIVEDE